MEKRFSIQPETFAQDRIEAVRNAVEQLQKEYPEVISATLFGSLSKGTSTTESDIDIALFVDADYIAEQERAEGKSGDDVIDEKRDYTLAVEGLKTQEVTQSIYLRRDLYEKYNQLIQEYILRNNASLTPEHVENARSLPMSEKKLIAVIDELIASRRQIAEYNKKVVAAHNGGSAYTELLATIQEIGGEPEFIFRTPTLFLGTMFHLDIGGGIRKYREILINKLLEEGVEGEDIWRDIIRYVERWEQKKPNYDKLPTNVRYPRTLAEAKEVYCHSV